MIPMEGGMRTGFVITELDARIRAVWFKLNCQPHSPAALKIFKLLRMKANERHSSEWIALAQQHETALLPFSFIVLLALSPFHKGTTDKMDMTKFVSWTLPPSQLDSQKLHCWHAQSSTRICNNYAQNDL